MINYCDYGHETSEETRMLPIGGGANVIVCRKHYWEERNEQRKQAQAEAGRMGWSFSRWLAWEHGIISMPRRIFDAVRVTPLFVDCKPYPETDENIAACAESTRRWNMHSAFRPRIEAPADAIDVLAE